MLLEIPRPVRREPARATVFAQLQRAFQMPQFNAEPSERRERVNDQPTAVTGDVIAPIGRAVLPPSMASPVSVPGGASQNAQPVSVC